MLKRTTVNLSLCFGFLALVCSTLFAQTGPGPGQIILTEPSSSRYPAEPLPPGESEIYSNLGPKGDLFYESRGYEIAGPDNYHGTGDSYLAMPFTPSVNSTLNAVRIALGYSGIGTDNGEIGIFTDSNGVPGEPLKLWGIDNLPQFGQCCRLVTLTDKAGVPLTAGTQYWVVAGTGPGSTRAIYEWNLIWNDSTGNLAFLNGFTHDQWLPFVDNLAAFAVYGTTP